MNTEYPPHEACAVLRTLLRPRLDAQALAFLAESSHEIADGAAAARLAQLLALASRHVRAGALLAPAPRAAAQAWKAGFRPDHWSLLEALRVTLLLACPGLDADGFVRAYDTCFRYADHGELCALYRSLPLLPRGERFAARAAEGCRSNMRTVFETVALDSPYPARHFDDIAWRQMVIKAVFIDAPLARVHGLDARLSPELARIALDLADERRSAGRKVPAQLWLCLGPHGGERGRQSLQLELAGGAPEGKRDALLALAQIAQGSVGHHDRGHA